MVKNVFEHAAIIQPISFMWIIRIERFLILLSVSHLFALNCNVVLHTKFIHLRVSARVHTHYEFFLFSSSSKFSTYVLCGIDSIARSYVVCVSMFSRNVDDLYFKFKFIDAISEFQSVVELLYVVIFFAKGFGAYYAFKLQNKYAISFQI